MAEGDSSTSPLHWSCPRLIESVTQDNTSCLNTALFLIVATPASVNLLQLRQVTSNIARFPELVIMQTDVV